MSSDHAPASGTAPLRPQKAAYDARRLVKMLIARGPRSCARWLVTKATDPIYEKRFGVRTGDFYDARSLGLDHDGEGYEPLDYRSLLRIMRGLGPPQGRGLVDYGSGLGRVLVAAAALDFPYVAGVEYSEPLCALARANMERVARTRPALRYDVICADASTYVLPAEVSIAWLFNPFTGPVLDAVIQRLRESPAHAQGRLTVVHIVPGHVRSPFPDLPWLRRQTAVAGGRWRQFTGGVYTSVRPGA